MATPILLISEQTLPNVLFLKHIGPCERYVFLTTEKMEMEGRSDWIINAARIHPDHVQRIEIDPENANYSLGILEKAEWGKNNRFLVNLTGGTKMMALAAYAFFSRSAQSRIFYLPINASHLLEIYPSPREIPMMATVSFEEYLNAYGAVIQSQNAAWSIKAGKAQEVMDAVLGKGYPDLLPLTKHEGSHHLNAEDRKFYSGEWLEIWIAWAIHRHWAIPEADIRVGVKLNRIGVSAKAYYEYDVMFIRNNRLYAGECKHFNHNKFHMSKINKELFKFASVNSQLGLYAKPFFAIANTISDSGQIQALTEQCKMLRLPYPADIEVLSNPKQFINHLQKN